MALAMLSQKLSKNIIGVLENDKIDSTFYLEKIHMHLCQQHMGQKSP